MLLLCKAAASRRYGILLAIAPLLTSPIASPDALAETLTSAVSKAMATNASLKAEEQTVFAAESSRARAEAEYRPNVQGYGQAARQRMESLPIGAPNTINSNLTPRGYGLQVSHNVWNGDKTRRTVAREEMNVTAAKSKFADFSQQLIRDAIAAYMNVVRERSIISQQRANVASHRVRFNEVKARFSAGLALDTDVQQARSYLSRAEADQLTAEANLATSVAQYRLIIGADPGALQQPAMPATLPDSLATALHGIGSDHPSIAAAAASAAAGKEGIGVARAGYLPSIDLLGTADHNQEPLSAPDINRQRNYTAMLKMTVPIYTGGRTAADVDLAVHQAAERQHRLDYQRDTVVASVTSAWGQYIASDQILAAAHAQSKSARIALTGIEVGERTGLRTASEYYEAKRVLVDAQVNAAIAERDRIVAAYSLLQAMGRLSEADIRTDDERASRSKPIGSWDYRITKH